LRLGVNHLEKVSRKDAKARQERKGYSEAGLSFNNLSLIFNNCR
jgi:hypothetical protein